MVLEKKKEFDAVYFLGWKIWSHPYSHTKSQRSQLLCPAQGTACAETGVCAQDEQKGLSRSAELLSRYMVLTLLVCAPQP